MNPAAVERQHRVRHGPQDAAANRESEFNTASADVWLDSTLNDRSTGAVPAVHWRGARLAILIACTLFAYAGLFVLVRSLAAAPFIDATWRADAAGRLRLGTTPIAALQPHQGSAVLRITGANGASAAPDAFALQRSARWVVDDFQRARLRALHEQLAAALAASPVTLLFAGGESVGVATEPRGWARLPPVAWALFALALGLGAVALTVFLAAPSMSNLLYAVMGCCQAGNLVFTGIEATLQLGLPPPWTALDMPLRMAFDLVTAAAAVHAACLHPRRLPGARAIAMAGWSVPIAIGLVAALRGLPDRWWWCQGAGTGLMFIATVLLAVSYRLEPHPAAMVLRRFVLFAGMTWLLLSAGVAASAASVAPQDAVRNLADLGVMVWYVFLGSLLLSTPFLAGSRLALREFCLLAAAATVATSLHLFLVATFAAGQFASLGVSLFVALILHAGARQWTARHVPASGAVRTERLFDQLYRMAREVEARPERAAELLARLLGDVFEPLDMRIVERAPAAAVAARDGSALLVPVPAMDDPHGVDGAAPGAVLLRFAGRGRRLFTSEDARFTDRVAEQLRRAVAFDKAVEQGRNEERLRLAQDLHDDIGARLLTLMYKAQSPEMEDYVRHTLQDLKTLTRGLAASEHRLSHAAAEWKADLTQRLGAARIELTWSATFDADALLSMVQWSALTRVLRELVSNVIAHSQARHVEIELTVVRSRLELGVTDDGIGRDPQTWSHGLGLGGVRKRVKQLGGDVEWREAQPGGIRCHVGVRHLAMRPAPAGDAPVGDSAPRHSVVAH